MTPTSPSRPHARLAATTAVALLMGCSAALPPRYHSLLPAPAAAPAQAAKPAGPIGWEVLPVTVPAGVDQPQWVVRIADGSLAVLEQERWIGPLGEEIRSAVSARMTQALGAPALSGAALWRVRIDVLRFESAPARESRLEITWSVASEAQPVNALRCRSEFVEGATPGGYLALAKAHQQGVARLADAIGRVLMSLSSGRSATCES